MFASTSCCEQACWSCHERHLTPKLWKAVEASSLVAVLSSSCSVERRREDLATPRPRSTWVTHTEHDLPNRAQCTCGMFVHYVPSLTFPPLIQHMSPSSTNFQVVVKLDSDVILHHKWAILWCLSHRDIKWALLEYEISSLDTVFKLKGLWIRLLVSAPGQH